MRKFILIAVAVLIMQGCATKYQKDGFSGGYSETKLDEKSFQVLFAGNGNTSREKVTDFALLRSAEVTLENGFQYFVITKAAVTEKHDRDGYGKPYSRFSSANIITCFKDKPENIIFYDAKVIYKNTAEKYGITPENK
jgi:hypothetical protein